MKSGKYRAVFRQSVQSALEYRGNFFLGLVSGAFTVIVQMFLWTAVYGGDRQTPLYGYSYAQMMVYLLLSGLMARLVSTGFEFEAAQDIKDGGLSKYLVQPIRYLPYRLSAFVGQKCVQLAFLLPISAVMVAAMGLSLGAVVSVSALPAALLSVCLALLLNCLLYYCVSALAFDIAQVHAFFTGINVISGVLSGSYFPLDVFGQGAMRVFSALPFQYVVYFPLNILTGRCAPGDIPRGLVLQCIWIFGLYLLSRLMWARGMKKYIAAGG